MDTIEKLTRSLAGLLVTVGVTVIVSQPSYAGNTYYCDRATNNNGDSVPATYARTPRGQVPIIYWIFTVSGWSPQARCEEVSLRLQRFHDNGLLNYLNAAIVNGQPAICVTPEVGVNCEHLLVMLPSHMDANYGLSLLLDIRGRVRGRRLEIGRGPVFYDNLQLYVDVEKFIDFISEEEMERTDESRSNSTIDREL